MTVDTSPATTFVQMLEALSGWLRKACAEKPGEAGALLSQRLAPDMFPLSTQVRFACLQALETVFRLCGEPYPDLHGVLLAEGRSGGEAPGTIAAAEARIAETLALVRSVGFEEPQLPPDAPVVHMLPGGETFDFTVAQYVRDWALPQFYFHLMIAYAILRSNGISLGKVDYVAHMFAHLRPGTMAGHQPPQS